MLRGNSSVAAAPVFKSLLFVLRIAFAWFLAVMLANGN